MNDHRETPKRQLHSDRMIPLVRYTELPAQRIEYHAEADVSLIETIERGVLFIMAFWSGPATKAFSELADVINRLDPKATLRFVVIDTDGAESYYHHPQFVGKLGGWGEAAWIRRGVIQFTSGMGYNAQCFEPNTRTLLAMP